MEIRRSKKEKNIVNSKKRILIKIKIIYSPKIKEYIKKRLLKSIVSLDTSF